MSSDLPRATTVDPLPRTVLAWQRTLISTAATALVLTLALVRAGAGVWSIAVLALAVLPIPAAVRREQSLIPQRPEPLAAWKPALVTGVVVLMACAGGLVLVVL